MNYEKLGAGVMVLISGILLIGCALFGVVMTVVAIGLLFGETGAIVRLFAESPAFGLWSVLVFALIGIAAAVKTLYRICGNSGYRFFCETTTKPDRGGYG